MRTMLINSIFFIISLFSSAISAEESDLIYSRSYNRELVIRGDYLKACSVALDDFEKNKALLTLKENGQSKINNVLSGYIYNPDNYNIEMGHADGRYIVWIHHRSTEKSPGLFGGDAEYIIDEKEFKIINKFYGK